MNSDELLGKLNDLKARSAAYAEKVEEAKARKAVIKAKLEELNQKLLERLGRDDWDYARDAIDKLSARAEKSVEALAEALDGIDFDFD